MSKRQNELTRIARRFVSLAKSESPNGILKKGYEKITAYSSYKSKLNEFKNRHFHIFGEDISYFIHHYNATWRNERCIEIGLALHYLNKWKPQSILEVGNVMSYYGEYDFDVVDLYEKSPGVINEDFLLFNNQKKYDAFIAISTFEHIGWDEAIKDKNKLKACLDKISQHVNDKDHVLVTMPCVYNSFLDELARNDELPFKHIEYLIRKNNNQEWQSVSVEEAMKEKYTYNRNYPAANSMIVGVGVK